MGLFNKSSWGAAALGVAQPNPYNFRLVREVRINKDYLLVEVVYPDATNFEGRKLILLTGTDSVSKLDSLDPHFLKNSSVTVVARFRPDAEGEKLALILADTLFTMETK